MPKTIDVHTPGKVNHLLIALENPVGNIDFTTAQAREILLQFLTDLPDQGARISALEHLKKLSPRHSETYDEIANTIPFLNQYPCFLAMEPTTETSI